MNDDDLNIRPKEIKENLYFLLMSSIIITKLVPMWSWGKNKIFFLSISLFCLLLHNCGVHSCSCPASFYSNLQLVAFRWASQHRSHTEILMQNFRQCQNSKLDSFEVWDCMWHCGNIMQWKVDARNIGGKNPHTVSKNLLQSTVHQIKILSDHPLP